MRMRVLLMGAALTLAACSNDGGSAAPRIDPLAKPSTPASDSYIQGALVTYSSSSKYLPGDAAMFKGVPDGMFSTKKRTIYDGSSERTKALDKLSNTGLRFVDKIKANCSLNTDVTEQNGQANKAGDSVYSDITMTSSGAQCPFIIKTQNSQKVTLVDIRQNPRGGGSVVATMNMAMKDARSVKDETIQSASGIKSTDFNIIADMNINAIVAPSGETTSMTINGTISGNVDIAFANGERITGPIDGDIASNSIQMDKMSLSIRFKGTSPQGDIWFVIVMKDGKGTLYINGKKLGDMNSVNSNLESALSALVAPKL